VTSVEHPPLELAERLGISRETVDELVEPLSQRSPSRTAASIGAAS
jgi:hypothetical protein